MVATATAPEKHWHGTLLEYEASRGFRLLAERPQLRPCFCVVLLLHGLESRCATGTLGRDLVLRGRHSGMYEELEIFER